MLLKLYRHLRFFRDIFVLAVTAFGGPNAHIALMLDLLVKRRHYLTEKELMELMALCQMLPGPTSTQMLTAIGYKKGGPLLALFTLLVWALPAVILMTLLAILYGSFYRKQLSLEFFRFIQPMAVGFIIYSAITICKTVIRNWATAALVALAAAAAIIFDSPWAFPAIILFCGLLTYFTKQEKIEVKPSRGKPNWIYLSFYIGIFLAAGTLAIVTDYRPVMLFENFYRFGSLVFGGGQVLLPMMYEQYTQHHPWMSEADFFTGVGMVNALPGPVFSIAAFAGGMSMQEFGGAWPLLGSLVASLAIFLPGALIVFFVYPLWEYLKRYSLVRKSIEGANAGAGGLVVAAAIIFFFSLNIYWPQPGFVDYVNLGIVAATALILLLTRIPSPLIVFVALLCGFLF